MKRVYFVRHGESESNVKGVLLGADTPLTERGYEQANFIAERCARLPIEAIISSTMLRARETARIISEKIKIPLELSDLFVERTHPDIYLGKSYDDPEIQRVEQILRDKFTEQGFRHSEEETFDDLKTRGKKALKFLEERKEGHLLVATHGTFLHVLFSLAVFGEKLSAQECHATLRTMRSANTGLTIFEHRDDDQETPWSVVVWNDHAHLAD